ncbi:MAG: orotidine-5'-phosphate decarboxylase [Gemmatimonadetes bacterium]|nr:orotidine-5'-phosphate decarboxylase [Gemmatimonadota bacterium]
MTTANGPVPIVALDVPTLAAAKELVGRLGPGADFVKVGLQLFVREGPGAVEWLRADGRRVFLDLKLHDIPNTVERAAASAAALGVELLTVHASGGADMMRAAVAGASGASGASGAIGAAGAVRTGVIGVTVLTSFSETAYAESLGIPGVSIAARAMHFAAAAKASGLRGVVCSGQEVREIRSACGPGFGTLVPGIRLVGAESHDQARVATPSEMRDAGATWVVLGRAVTAAEDPAAALALVRAALRGA